MKRFGLGLIAVTVFAAAAGCGKEHVGLGAYTGAAHETSWGVNCIDEPADSPNRKVDPFSGQRNLFDPPLPESIPVVYTPIEVKDSCSALKGAPLFPEKIMPGFIARVDCNARVVHFRTRDYQVTEIGRLSLSGEFNVVAPYITRLTQDADGAADCWRRFIANIQGTVTCPTDNPMGAQIRYNVAWTIDPTPAEIMEPARPSQADHRVGKYCRTEGNSCEFINRVAMSCHGGI